MNKQAMTLREQCEAFLCSVVTNSMGVERDIDRLEAFARQQQAVGLREAVDITTQHHAPHHWYWVWLKEQCEQRAREREGS